MSQTILITGGSRGIGRATTEKFLENGYRVIATSTSGTFDYTHKNLITHVYDQANPKSIKEFVAWLKEEDYKIDVCINNAGIMLDWTIDTVEIEILRKTMEVNLFGLVDFTQQVLDMMNKNSLIINIASGLGAMNDDMGTTSPSYSITKVSVNMYTKKLHAKIHENGISVISYEPGWVKTDMGGEAAPREVGEPAQDLFNLATKSEKPQSGLFYNSDGVRDW